MCLIGIAYKAHPQFELVLAANRDEFHHRPTAAAAFWPDSSEIYGGRDLSQGGGWLALSTKRRLAAVTNVRRMQQPDAAAPSRGKLVADFVREDCSANTFANWLRNDADRYAGFNLLLWDGDELLHLTNQPEFRISPVEPGVHGLSNATLDTPWPKLLRVKDGLADWTQRGATDDDSLARLLGDTQLAADTELPDTGVGIEMERFLAPPFIVGPHYGTRASAVVTINNESAGFFERRFGPNGALLGESRESLTLRSQG